MTSPSEAQATPTSPVARHSHARGASESPGKDEREDGQREVVVVVGDRERGEREHHQHQQHGTLVARAAEIVSSARGFFGAIWNAV